MRPVAHAPTFNGALARSHYPRAFVPAPILVAPQRFDPPFPTSPPRTPAREPSLSEPASLRFAADGLPWQRSLRWTRPLRDRRAIAFCGVLALLVVVLELVGFALGMKPLRPLPRAGTIQVVLIEPEPPPPPAPPEPEPPEIVRRASRIAIDTPQVRTKTPPPERTEAGEPNARIGSAGVAAPQLFNPDGSIRLGGSGVVAPPSPKPENPQEAAKARWAQIEKRGNPLDCKKTRFAGAFQPDMDLGDKVASRYLKWIGLADGEAIAHRRRQRADSGGCEPAE